LFFFGGYLFYSSIFGAIGSAVDSETDTQQFMFPIMMPLIAGYIFSMITVQDPTSNLAFWASMVPFTSPIVMMVRLPFGVETWEIVLSLTILAISTVGMVWLAGRIYRVGILMYGKKPSFKEIWKWMWYKG
jgi:ABC-2 type transport system permease protein